MEKRRWIDVSNDAISERAIRSLHIPEEAYKISRNSYDPGVSFPGTLSVPATVYILSGSCKYKIGDDEQLLHALDFLEIEAGRYIFEVLDDTPVKLVSVFALPPSFWKREE